MRKSLRNYLGKKLTFTGTIGSPKITSGLNQYFVENVKYKNKRMTDHIWYSKSDMTTKYEEGTEISFIGTVVSYIDKKDRRKYGIKSTHNLIKIEALHIFQKVQNDWKHRQKRR